MEFGAPGFTLASLHGGPDGCGGGGFLASSGKQILCREQQDNRVTWSLPSNLTWTGK